MAKEEDEARFTVVAKKEDEAVSAAVAKKADMARRATMANNDGGNIVQRFPSLLEFCLYLCLLPPLHCPWCHRPRHCLRPCGVSY